MIAAQSLDKNTPAHLRRTFNRLILYRWLSLIPPLIFLWRDQATGQRPLLAGLLLAAALVALLITVRAEWLNRRLQRWPFILTFDLMLCAVLIVLSGGLRSPYYLHSLSPILAAAFFFHVRGALLAATGFAPLFILATTWAGGEVDTLAVIEQVVGVYLIGGVFGYQPTLMSRLSGARDDLERAHRDLNVIHELTLSLQSAVDVNEVEQRVLGAVTGDLGFPRAIVALVDQNERTVTSWLGRARDGRAVLAGEQPHSARVPLAPEGGTISSALLDGQPRLPAKDVRTSDEFVNRHLGVAPYYIFPMLLREHPVGVLLVDASDGEDPARLRSLQAIASQAAVAVGTTMLCIDRAQRLAVQEERVRFSHEIHDTVSQSLFGIVYALDGLGKLLPDQPDRVKAELEQIKQIAEETRAEVRQSILDIWPSALTGDVFQRDLRRFVEQFCRPNELQLDIRVHGEFASLSPRRQRSLYRIAQEALTNVVKHAGAQHAEVHLEVENGRASLRVHDDGRGFDPAAALARERDREHFGLKGIQERAEALGGACRFESRPGAGTTLTVSLPFISTATEV
jgi:signal transduction histidine kinase